MIYYKYKNSLKRDIVAVSKKEVESIKKVNRELAILNQEIDKLTHKKFEIMDNCNHEIFYDEVGFGYDIRYCAKCGRALTLV